MKKTIAILMIALLALLCVFANGAPEDIQQLIDSLYKDSQPTYTSTSANTTSSVGSEKISRDMATLERLYQYVEKNFLYEIDYDAVYEAMATALFDTLGDKYSYYVKAEASESYEEEVTGTYGGLGIYFSKTYVDYQDPDDESTIYCLITQVFPNTPAARAGLKAQDYIIAIDGEDVNELEANDCAKRMKGEVGTQVELTIKRNDSIFSVTIKREVIVVPTTDYTMLDKNVGYLVINEFSTGTDLAVYKALVDMQSKGMDKMILDLRNCPGGDVDVALTIADMFIDGGKLLTVSYKDESKNITYKANSQVVLPTSVKVIVLINGGTASSAEILSSALQGSGRATVMGSTSYGKGIMQMISSFGTGYTSLTTASFVGPSGDTIHENGVKPDYEVEEITVLDEELDAYTALLESKRIEEYVDSNPEMSRQNIENFATQNPDTGLRAEVVNLLVRNEYYSRLITDDIPVADTVFDNVIKAAYEMLTK